MHKHHGFVSMKQLILEWLASGNPNFPLGIIGREAANSVRGKNTGVFPGVYGIELGYSPQFLYP